MKREDETEGLSNIEYKGVEESVVTNDLTKQQEIGEKNFHRAKQ